MNYEGLFGMKNVLIMCIYIQSVGETLKCPSVTSTENITLHGLKHFLQHNLHFMKLLHFSHPGRESLIHLLGLSFYLHYVCSLSVGK